MIIKNEKMLERFRFASKCEFCRSVITTPAHPHHLRTRGFGGGSRLDVPYNLISLCSDCHRGYHDGKEPLYCDMLAVVAARENVLQSDVEAFILRLRKMPRNTDSKSVVRLLAEAESAEDRRFCEVLLRWMR